MFVPTPEENKYEFMHLYIHFSSKIIFETNDAFEIKYNEIYNDNFNWHDYMQCVIKIKKINSTSTY